MNRSLMNGGFGQNINNNNINKDFYKTLGNTSMNWGGWVRP